MNEQELKVIIDVNKSLQSLNDTTHHLYKIMDNLINTVRESNTMSEISSLKIDELKEKVEESAVIAEEIKKKIDLIVLQNDWKEMSGVKNKKINDKLNEKLNEKKFSWKDFGDGVKLFFKNSKWVFLTIAIITAIVLIIMGVVKIEEALDWLKHMFIGQSEPA